MAEQTAIEWADSTFNPWMGLQRDVERFLAVAFQAVRDHATLKEPTR